MLETLLKKILTWDLPSSPEILLEEDGDLCLDWNGKISVSINKNGNVNWAGYGEHGTDIDELARLLGKAAT